ncbi:MAG: hypothetical protein E7170_03470 [Firmicutes bacterium]|nr:hypothetical protein [Bacillota bacterium]
MEKIISLIISVIVYFIVYKIFENRGFKAALIFKLFYQFMVYLITGSIPILFSVGILQSGIILVTVFVVILISTAVEYYAYTRTNNFITYLILVIIVSYITAFLLTALLAFLIAAFV